MPAACRICWETRGAVSPLWCGSQRHAGSAPRCAGPAGCSTRQTQRISASHAANQPAFGRGHRWGVGETGRQTKVEVAGGPGMQAQLQRWWVRGGGGSPLPPPLAAHACRTHMQSSPGQAQAGHAQSISRCSSRTLEEGNYADKWVCASRAEGGQQEPSAVVAPCRSAWLT